MKKKDYMQSVFSGISRHGMRMGQLRVLWTIGFLDGVASLSDMLLATGISESHAQAALRALISTGEVEVVGTKTAGVGRPGRIYRLTPKGRELFIDIFS